MRGPDSIRRTSVETGDQHRMRKDAAHGGSVATKENFESLYGIWNDNNMFGPFCQTHATLIIIIINGFGAQISVPCPTHTPSAAQITQCRKLSLAFANPRKF